MNIDLYRYYPTFVKLKDHLASGLDENSTQEAVLQKLTYMIEQLFDDTDEFIRLLLQLNDPDTVEQKYFSHVSYLLGMMLPNGASEEEIRFIIKQLVNHYKTSGTHHSWHRALEWSNQPATKVVELFKHEQNEVANYSTVRSVSHPLKSARIQLGVCASSCESICEVVCESSCESIVEIGAELPVAEALRRLSYVEYLRPIHVILRQNAEDVALRSGFPNAQETIGHYPMVYGVDPDPWEGSQVHGTFRNNFFTVADELAVAVECVALCEVSCQSCCEAVCECNPCEVVCQVGGCELQCTENCQAFCEFACEAACVHGCTSCQAGTCTAECAGACLGTCQGGGCTSACQGSCASTCQAASCTTTCQGPCTSACQGTCTSACQGTCTSECQGDCTSECQGDCTSTCQGGCASTCQTFTCTTGNCEGSCESDCQAIACVAWTCQSSYCMAEACQVSYCMSANET